MKMSSVIYFNVASWFLGNVWVKPYFNTQSPPRRFSELPSALNSIVLQRTIWENKLQKLWRRPTTSYVYDPNHSAHCFKFIKKRVVKSPSYKYWNNYEMRTLICSNQEVELFKLLTNIKWVKLQKFWCLRPQPFCTLLQIQSKECY